MKEIEIKNNQENFPVQKVLKNTIKRLESQNFRVRYKTLRNLASNYIKKEQVRQIIFKVYDHKCYICGSNENLQIDHIISVYAFATHKYPYWKLNAPDNLALICSHCNASRPQ